MVSGESALTMSKGIVAELSCRSCTVKNRVLLIDLTRLHSKRHLCWYTARHAEGLISIPGASHNFVSSLVPPMSVGASLSKMEFMSLKDSLRCFISSISEKIFWLLIFYSMAPLRRHCPNYYCLRLTFYHTLHSTITSRFVSVPNTPNVTL